MIICNSAQHADLAAQIASGATALVAFAASISAGVAFLAVRTQAKSAADQMRAATEAAKMQSRANVVSASRQRWIDALRDDIAEFLTVDSQVKVFDVMPSQHADVNLASIRERDRISARGRQALARIHLRLNPNEEEHDALFKKLMELPAMPYGQSGRLVDEIIAMTQVLLKGEWNRVKREASGDVALSTPPIS